MKKHSIIILLILVSSLSAFGANYKINSSGKVTTPKGSVVSPVSNSPNNQNPYINNFQAENYVNSNQVNVDDIGIINLVIDCSGSMTNWIQAAKRALSSIIYQLPASTQIGLRTFGDEDDKSSGYVLGDVKNIVKDKKQKYKISAKGPSYLKYNSTSCTASKQLVRVDSNSKNTLLNALNSVRIGGNTPLTYALYKAAFFDFTGMSLDKKKKIIIITDGEETCGSNPCAFAADLMKKRNDIVIDVLLVSSYSKELKCLADATGGKFYNIADTDKFIRTLKKSITEQAVPEQSSQQNYEYVDD